MTEKDKLDYGLAVAFGSSAGAYTVFGTSILGSIDTLFGVTILVLSAGTVVGCQSITANFSNVPRWKTFGASFMIVTGLLMARLDNPDDAPELQNVSQNDMSNIEVRHYSICAQSDSNKVFTVCKLKLG